MLKPSEPASSAVAMVLPIAAPQPSQIKESARITQEVPLQPQPVEIASITPSTGRITQTTADTLRPPLAMISTGATATMSEAPTVTAVLEQPLGMGDRISMAEP